MSRLVSQEYLNERIANVKHYIEFNERENDIKFFAHKELEIYQMAEKYMQLSNELGCSLEVVFKAIEDGIVIIGDLEGNGDMTLWLDKKPLIALIGEKRNFEEPRLIKYNNWCFTCESGSFHGCVSLKDYGKTWWLKGDKESSYND